MKILVCVKENAYRKKILKLLELMECEEEKNIESYSLLPKSLKKYDIAFLDLRIDAKRALNIGKKLYEINYCVNFYLYDDYTYVHDFFMADGFQYLLKDQDRLIVEELKRAYEYYLDVHYKLVLKSETENLSLNPYHIQYIEYAKHSMKVVIGNHQYEGIIENYDVVKAQLKKLHFIEAHPHYLVNARYIIEYKARTIKMKNNDILPTNLTHNEILKAIHKVK